MKKLLSILLLLTSVAGSYAQRSGLLRSSDFKSQKINGKWIYVKYKNAPKPDGTSLKLADSNSSLSAVRKLKVPNGKDPIAFCNELRQSSNEIIYADPIVQYVPLSVPTDALISSQYYLDNIRAFDAWEITRGDDDITIGIIDSGLDLDHEDIVTNLWLNTDDPVDGIDNDNNGYIDDYYGYDFADSDTDPNIQNGNHGMIVAGIAGAVTNNEKGIAGVGYNTKVAALKGFRSSDGISGGLYDAIIYAAENGFDVVNLSWGRMGIPLQSEQDIINYAVIDHDMVVVAAAGNEGGKVTEENNWYPASYDHVLSVGASDAADNKSSGSTFNHSVDLIAPGVSMFSTVNGNSYANGGPGTSFASPQVAAAAALVKEQYPDLTAIQIMERVRATSDDIYDVGSNSTYDGKLGKGRLNVLRAVSESNVKSLRAESPSLTSAFGENVFFGDTVKVSAILTNHLSPINSPLVTISSPNNDFTISQGSFEPGYLNTNDTQEISFDIILDDDISPETEIEIRFDYAATGYNDFQFLDVTTSPDYADFGNNILSMTVSGDGNLGFNNYEPFEGSGFIHQLDTLMKYTGIMIASSSLEVSDNIISNYSNLIRNEDFTGREFYKLYHHPASDHFGYSEFDDLARPLIVEQSNIAWEDENFMILRYRIVNNSSSAINNLAFGVFADWDLSDKTENYAEYDLTDNYIFATNSEGSLYAGVQLLGGDNFEFSVLDMDSFNGNTADIENTFSDSEKYDFLVNQALATAGSIGNGNDVATLNGVTVNQIDPFSAEYINVIYAISDSQVNLENTLNLANNRLASFLQKPRVFEVFSVCDGTNLSIDPTEGEVFEFYEDPLAQTLITTGSSLNAGIVTKDTSFYIRNLDQSYPSDVFELSVKLFNEIADFEISTDTLYLDNEITNAVQFTDASLDAVSWNWDFDQGTSSTIQNPSLSFSEPGTYSVTLEVTNALGCTDQKSKDLVVANRPAAPVISDVVICPGENVTLADSGAEKIHLYAFENSLNASMSGSEVSIPSVDRDTTVFVSGVFSSFESSRVPVNIDVLEVSGEILHHPDTTTEEHRIQLTATGIASGSTVQWVINGSNQGSSTQLSIPSTEGLTDVRLEITSADNCQAILNESISVSTSPFASQEDLFSCSDEGVDIRPENGNYFGFYEDPELTTLIKKGSHLKTNQFSKVYVVNLDDGLPGMPIEVNITDQSLTLEIQSEITEIGSKNKVDLSADTNDEIVSYEWYINGELSENSEKATFFLDAERYEIVLKSTSSFGCSAIDTLNLDLRVPLSIEENSIFTIYPNPTNGPLNIETNGVVKELSVYSLAGREILTIKEPKEQVNLGRRSKGLYIIKATIDGEVYEEEIIIK